MSRTRTTTPRLSTCSSRFDFSNLASTVPGNKEKKVNDVGFISVVSYLTTIYQ